MKRFQKILVTGHRGYIGSRLFSKLKLLGHHVDGIDLKDGDDVLHTLPNNVKYDTVFHMCAMPKVEYSVKNPSYTLMHNVLGTSRILEWASKTGVSRVVFSSSSAIYGDGSGPNSPYGLHKLMSEQECRLFCKLHKMDTVCLRYFNVYSEDQPYGGAYSTIVSAWREMIKTGNPLRVDGDGQQTRDFIHVDDVVSANIFCMNFNKNFNGACYDVGTGNSISVNDIKKIVEKYHTVEWETRPERKGDVKHTCADIEELGKIGWKAEIKINQGIEKAFRKENR
jgi:UDP-glucose 4-epimerase